MNATRLDIRLNADSKTLIQQAAELRNQTVTQFVVATLLDEAGKVVAEHAQVVLSDRDRDLFLKLLDAPPRPNKALRDAVKSHQKRRLR
ncbi:MAG: DUF1778 domain-containing protein [Candidatus Hydrogenedentes bacterium]|nr:DUF1778 domain-containing protein [Candidatus Hydrogenedentota bacterium]